MEIKRGIAVSPGVAIGPALVLDTEWYRIPQRFIEPDQSQAEVARLQEALNAAARRDQHLSGRRQRQARPAVRGHLRRPCSHAPRSHAVSGDRELDPRAALRRRVRGQPGDPALCQDPGRHQGRFCRLAHQRPVRHRKAHPAAACSASAASSCKQLSASVIVLAHDLTPSETATLDPKRVHAFATEAGGRASHTAIIAGVLEIPAVVGLGKLHHRRFRRRHGHRRRQSRPPDPQSRRGDARALRADAHQLPQLREPARRAARPACLDTRRHPHPAAGQHRVSDREQPLPRARRRRRRPVSH